MHTFPNRGGTWIPDPHNTTFTIGHAGADYGSLGMMTGYNWKCVRSYLSPEACGIWYPSHAVFGTKSRVVFYVIAANRGAVGTRRHTGREAVWDSWL